MARKTEPKRPGKPIDLKRGRCTVLRPLGPCELRIVPEIYRGRVRIRVWGPDGVEIEHFRVNQ